jgi:uncharacterized protein (TIGR00661 family)
MKFEEFNRDIPIKNVLVAPLDWGLGHATRCIPIIYTLISLNINVIVAAEGPIKNLLKKEFPNVVFTVLKGYKVHYSKSKRWFYFNLLLQFPKILWRIYQENKWLKKIIAVYNIDAVISDNRFGLYNAKLPCIYITHQLNIKTGNRLSEWIGKKIHYHFINKYTVCWVPDNAGSHNLGGLLSHPEKLPATPVHYISPLSRFEKITVEKKYDLLILLSGPEPQRTMLEELLMNEVKDYTGKVLIVKGLPGNSPGEELLTDDTNKITVVNHLSATALNKAIQQSAMVISRSGYTTIMDLVAIQQKAIFIPTPGQTEQEYLAEYLMQQKFFFAVAQKNFSLKEVLAKAALFNYEKFYIDKEEYKKAVTEFVLQLK